MTFVGIRLISVGFTVCRTKRKKCRGANGVGYCPFPFWVATLQWCRDSRGHDVHGRHSCVHDRGPACTRIGVLGKACHDRGPLVAKEMAQSVFRHRPWCCDRGAELLGWFVS